MRRRYQWLQMGWIAVLAMIALALWPFLSRSGLPHFTDAELHVYRLAELARLVAAGELYPRWAPNFYFGYGYPIFNYYAPLSYYAGLPVALLPWWDAVAGVRAVFMAGIAAGAIGTYAFVRNHWGRPAGLVAAAAYIFAPYVLYVDPHARGDLAEAFALGMFPIALWAVDRLQRRNAAAWLMAVAAVAAVIASHNLLALVSFALLLAWVLWQCVTGDEGRALCGLRLGALGAGTGLAAFFWLPVALEQDAVNLSSLIGPGGHFDYRNHFLSLAQLLAPVARLDWGASEAAFPFSLGLFQWLLALAGVLLLVARKTRASRRLTFFALAAGALLLMMLPVSAPLWEAFPLLPYLQFPWRLLGPIALPLAVLAGAASDALARAVPHPASRFIPAALVVLTVIAVFPLLQVPPWPEEPWDTSAAGVLAEERRGRWLGTTSTADFVPATVDVIPRATDQLLAAIEEGEPPDRVNRATLPQGTVVREEMITPLHTRYYVSAPDPFPLRLYQFAFPGWEARVDGTPVTTEIGLPEGFLVVPLPAGTYQVDVDLVATPAQRLARIISGLSLLSALGVAIGLQRQAPGPAPAVQEEARDSAAQGTILLAVVTVGLLYVFLSGSGWLHIQSTGFEAIPAQNDLFANVGGEIALIGYDAPAQARAGTTIAVTLYWKAQQAVSENYQVFVHLLDADGVIVAQSDKLNPGEFPTRRWSLDRYVRDQHRLRLPVDLAAGGYRLTAGMWLQSEARRLPVLDSQDRVTGDVVILGSVIVGD